MRGVLLAVLVALPAPLLAQGGTHVLVITGLSAEPAAAERFKASAGPIVDAAKTKWGVSDSSLVYLAENPAADPQQMLIDLENSPEIPQFRRVLWINTPH